MKFSLSLTLPLIAALVALAQSERETTPSKWEAVLTESQPLPRHESAFIKVQDRFFALGGRRIQPVDRFDPKAQRWTQGSPPPVELHHFQAVQKDRQIIIGGAFTGAYPGETPLPHLYFYDVEKDQWSEGPEIPEDRRRGSAGAFLKDGKLYLICGLTDGHRSGWVPWFDEYDFETQVWRRLPDAPRPRDHFQATLIGETLVLAGGRRSGADGQTFKAVTPEVDLFDFQTGTWTTSTETLPEPRAGTMSLALDGKALVIGGEANRPEAYARIDASDPKTHRWSRLADLPNGLHASQVLEYQDALYIVAGSVAQGGHETNALIKLPLTRAAENASR